jgi:hypothetical protein
VSAKDLNDKYRATATRLIAQSPFPPLNAENLRVVPHGSVMPMEDGAFVELQVWVPKAALEAGDAAD